MCTRVVSIPRVKLSDPFSSAIYITGIMFYKFGLELFNGSISTLATDRSESAGTFAKCE